MESNKCDPSFEKGFRDGHGNGLKCQGTMTDKMPVTVFIGTWIGVIATIMPFV